MSFTVGSLFDGSGGFPLAAFMCGGVPVWASEIEPYPIAVTKSRFPYVKHLGSVTGIKGNEVEPVDVITFGSPCQDLSIAGLRKGLKHEDNGDDETTRSGLFMEAVRIIKEMREATGGKYPRFALWENVPGAFSSNKGEDFRVVCEELIKIVEPSAVMPPVPKAGWAYADHYCGDGWSLAYRVFDAQFWGVPQRRRRIYLVLDLAGQCAKEILFERDGLRGYFAEGRTPWQGVTGDAAGGAGTADSEAECVVYSLDPLSSNSMKSSNPYSGCHKTEIARTIDTTDPNPSKNQGGIAILQPAYVGSFLPQKKAEAMGWSAEDVSCTLHNGACPGFQNAVVLSAVDSHILDDQGGSQISVRDDGKSPTLRAEMHGNIPCVMEAAGFKELNSAKARSDAYEHEVAPCLSANKHDASVCVKEQYLFENHSQDSRYKGPLGVCPMLPAQLGTGGNNQPFVVERSAFRKGTRPHSKDEAQKWETADVANTLNTFDTGEARANELVVEGHPEVVCCIDGDKIGKAERSGGSGLGIRAGDKMHTLTAKDAGTHAVAYGIGNGQANQSVMEERTGALNCMHDQQAVVYGVDCRNATEYPELNGTLQAKPGGGTSLNCNQVVRIQYIVRRLTPTECARLQGFPDDWGHPDVKTEFTDEEYRFWLNVRNTHAEINGKDTKDYTRGQMLTWYNKLHTDSSEYKMWGNGIALPNALYVMQGISDVLK